MKLSEENIPVIKTKNFSEEPFKALFHGATHQGLDEDPDELQQYSVTVTAGSYRILLNSKIQKSATRVLV